jgi:xylulokinase
MKGLIGIDIGTQGTKTALFDEAGACLATALRPSKLHQPGPGVVEEDPDDQLAAVCQGIRACVKSARVDPASVAGIGIDGQMAGVIGVGADGIHATPYDSWLDTRCAPYIRVMEEKAGDRIVAKCGGPPSINHGPKKLWWMHERPGDYRRIRAFVQPGGYAAMRLCGLTGDDAFIDTSYLHFSGFADNVNARWDPELVTAFGFDGEKLPRIVQPGEVVGELTGAMARRCGLKPGVPVIAGCGDTAASFLSCGATAEGVSVDVAGTASVFAATTGAFRPDAEHRTLAFSQSAVPGLWHAYAYINGGGMNLEWFLREVANRGKVRGKGLVTLQALNRLAEEVAPDAHAPLFVPHLGGRVSPSQPELRGAWVGLNWSHGLGHLYRAALEGVALEYAVYQRILRELLPERPMKELRITGGGEKSPLWNRIKADVLQAPVRRVGRDEGAPLGVALLAGHGVGLFRSLPAAARTWIPLGEKVRPRKAMAGYYAPRLERYERLVRLLDPEATHG